MKPPFIPTAQIVVGQQAGIHEHIMTYISRILCLPTCYGCATCARIRKQQHSQMLLLSPEKGYTLDDLAPIFGVIRYKRDAADPFFIIIEKAETMSVMCGNALLKSVEEPPVGYHFIFATTQLSELLPTIRSRCHIIYCPTQIANVQQQSMADVFMQYVQPKAEYAVTMLEKNKMSEQETKELFEQLFLFWTEQAKAQEDTLKRLYARENALLLSSYCATSIPAGHSALVLKNLFIQMYICRN